MFVTACELFIIKSNLVSLLSHVLQARDHSGDGNSEQSVP